MLRRTLLASLVASSLAVVTACTTFSEAEADATADTPRGGTTDPAPPGASEGVPPAKPYSSPLPESEGEDDAGEGPKDAGKDASKDTGTSPSDASSGGTSSGGPSPGACSVTRSGGGGSDPSGVIPVCCTPTTSQKAQLDTLFTLLNEYRAENGKTALAYDPKLEAAVQGHCEHMVDHGFFDHDAPEAVVAKPTDRAILCGTTANSENLAGNQSSPAAVMASWKESSGHNSNMLANWKRVGLCRAGSYWGQLFGL